MRATESSTTCSTAVILAPAANDAKDLDCSGPALLFRLLSALIDQTVWFRELRLIFGVSTYATGAVLAIFMGGLGFGSAILGKRADTKPSLLRF